ncbi:MAG TPA: carbohydrate ABC transporter permease [Propionicimonas sp.]|jgi:multiple sugar transport system permease protein
MASGRPRTGRRVVVWARRLAIAVLLLFTIAPLYWLLTLSTLSNAEVVSAPPRFVPNLGTFGPLTATTGDPIGTWLFNSVLVALAVSGVSIVLALFPAFALSRFRFRGRGLFGFLVFATQMMPAALLIVPLYSMFAGAKLIDNLLALVLAQVAFAMPVAIWVIKQAIDSVPIELDESVKIDGGTSLDILGRIILRLTAPAVAAAAIIAFLSSWNDYLFANTFAVSTTNWTATKGIASFFGQYTTPINMIMGTAVLFAIPPLIFFLLLQRQLVSGLTAGGVKG